MKERLRELKVRQRRRRQMGIIAAFFGVLVIGGVVWGMTRPGVAMTGDATCGIEEHKHSDKCYENVLVCDEKESEGHKHDDSCYKTEEVLVCDKEETEANLEEGIEGHTHDKGCYEEKKELVCKEEESKGHTHTDKCYKKELVCGKEEHTHEEDCYIDRSADVEKKSDWDKQYKSTKWKDAWGEDLVTAAEKQVGYKESTKNYKKVNGDQKGYTRYGEFSGELYADWDAAFVNFCIHYAGISKSDVFPNTTDTNKWYNKFSKVNGSFLTAPEGYEPEKGDIVFFEKKKGETDFTVGIVSSSDKDKKEIKVIEGNVDNEVKEEKYGTGDSQIFAYIKVTELEQAFKGMQPDDAENKEESEEPDQTTEPEETEEPAEEETEDLSPEFDSEYEGDGVIIHVKADEGVVPEGAELSVTPIEKKKITSDMSAEEKEEAEKVNEQYDMTSEKLNEESEKNEQELQGFLAYDISFMLDGKEIEPNGEVKVTMDFKEAVVPEGVSENAQVAVNHLKENGNGGVKVENLTEASTTNITTAEKDVAVEKVELVANDFSIFTVTWGGNLIKKFDVKYFDTSGNEISEEISAEIATLSLEQGKKINLETYLNVKTGNDEYEFQRIDFKSQTSSYNNSNNVTEIEWSYDYDFGDCLYIYSEENPDGNIIRSADGYFNDEYEIHVIYKRIKMTSVPTIDSSSRIEMKMIDYDTVNEATNVPFYTEWENNNLVQQGILDKTLSSNGYPDFSTPVADRRAGKNGNISNLSQLFEGARSANHLFLASYYGDNGHYYHYDSRDNAASFNEKTGNFIVGKEKITPGYDSKEDENHEKNIGNFLPYNVLGGETQKEGLYNAAGGANYHFGMELSAEFIQMGGGVYDGEPIKYEFRGDDDLWVYIDGVLVLDMGGCHTAQEGYIDFQTGDVYIQNIGTTNLKTIFKNALGENSEKFKKIEWNGNTFADYSGHDFKMWYMERGGNVSNLKLHFNLPTVRKDHVQLEKKLLDADGKEVNGKYSDEKFYFEVWAQEIDTTNSATGVETYKDSYIKLKPSDAMPDGSGREIIDAETGDALPFSEDGILTLRANQVAAIGNASGNRKIYFKEVNLPTDKYDADKVTINAANENEIHRTPNEDNNTASIESDRKTVSERKRTIFTNYLKDESVKELEITKKFGSSAKPGQDEEEFEVAIEFLVDGKWTPYTGEYEVFDGNGEIVNSQNNVSDNEKEGGSEESIADDANAGRIRIKKDYIIKIPGMTEGMQYRVYETDRGTFESDPTYKKGNNPVECEQISGGTTPDKGITGTIGNSTESITIVNSNEEVQNVLKKISFQKIWDDYDNYFGKRPEKIFVTLAYKKDGEFVRDDDYKQELSEENGWSWLWEDVPSVVDGESREWTVMELDVDGAYYERGENDKGFATAGLPSPDISQYNIDDLKDLKPTDNKDVKAFSDDTSDIVPTDYYYIVNSLNPEAFSDWEMLKKSTSQNPDTDEPLLLKGATFEITKKGASEGEQTITDEDGVIRWPYEAIEDGEYYLSELSAPSGYSKSPKSWTILIENGIPVIAARPDGDKTDPGAVVDEETGQIKFYFENTPVFSLPSTGGKGIYLYMFSGILLMAGGLLMTYKNRRRGVLRS